VIKWLIFEQQLQETTEKYDEEMKEKELIFDKQRKELLNERKKNKELEKELRVFEDSVINGSALPKEMTKRKSTDSSPEVPNPKRAKVDVIEIPAQSLRRLDAALKSLSGQRVQMRDYNKRVENLSAEPVKAKTTSDRGKNLIERARVLVEDETKTDDVMTSAYSQSLRDNAKLLVMTKDARSIRPSGQQTEFG
jgi:hypothetical protein